MKFFRIERFASGTRIEFKAQLTNGKPTWDKQTRLYNDVTAFTFYGKSSHFSQALFYCQKMNIHRKIIRG